MQDSLKDNLTDQYLCFATRTALASCVGRVAPSLSVMVASHKPRYCLCLPAKYHSLNCSKTFTMFCSMKNQGMQFQKNMTMHCDVRRHVPMQDSLKDSGQVGMQDCPICQTFLYLDNDLSHINLSMCSIRRYSESSHTMQPELVWKGWQIHGDQRLCKPSSSHNFS